MNKRDSLYRKNLSTRLDKNLTVKKMFNQF